MDHLLQLRQQVRQRDKEQLKSLIEKSEWGKVFSHLYDRNPRKKSFSNGKKLSAEEIIKISDWVQRYLRRLMKNT